MNAKSRAAIMAAMVAMGGGVGGTLLLTDESTTDVTAEQVTEGSAPDKAFVIADKDGNAHGWANDTEASRKLLARAKVFANAEPVRIDVFSAEACRSGLGYEVYTTSSGHSSECLPPGIFTDEPDAGIIEQPVVEEVDAGVEVPPIEF